jgi:3',5'-cyclic AMP phosphodiesterase CpdA
MKIAVLGDVHLIADDDPYKKLHERRLFFKSAWPSFQRLLTEVNGEAPDLVILLGDLVDWFSPQNIAFGLDLLSALTAPWYMTPGNHDLAAPSGGADQQAYHTEATRDYLIYWAEQGVDLSNRTLATAGFASILLDSALSNLTARAGEWLYEAARSDVPNLLFTHVPIDVNITREYILSVDARRSMTKYVISAEPELYGRSIAGRIDHVFTGHLHFDGDLRLARTHFHLCNMSVTMDDPNRSYGTVATAKIIECGHGAFTCRDLIVQ